MVEDFAPLRDAVVRGLSRAGYLVDSSGDGGDGLDLAMKIEPSLVVLDLMLPGLDGFEFLRRLRQAGIRSRVLILTARDALDDRVRGLDLGGDDYLVKPFAFDEFLARVRALLRRDEENSVRIGDLVVDRRVKCATRGGVVLELTPREFAVLECLSERAGRPVPREEILLCAFPRGDAAGSNVVEVCVAGLRKKLEDGSGHRLIHTRRGFGYVLGAEG